MATRITQVDNVSAEARTINVGGGDAQLNSLDINCQTTILKVEGTLHLRDAELLEKICRDAALQCGRPITLDLASISFIDSDSATQLDSPRTRRMCSRSTVSRLVDPLV